MFLRAEGIYNNLKKLSVNIMFNERLIYDNCNLIKKLLKLNKQFKPSMEEECQEFYFKNQQGVLEPSEAE
jgi:hypothetical protein